MLQDTERSPVDFLDVLAFVRIVETGAFSRAAERMDLSKSVLSRRVARLESKLGARLLTRSAQGARPTDIGQAYYERASAILAELEAAQEVVADAVTRIAGAIRIAAPVSFGTAHLAPALAEFAALHPRVELDVALSDSTVDLVAGGFDLAVRVGNLADSSLIARRIAPVRAVVVASPSYLDEHGRPAHPRELGGHALLSYANIPAYEQWRFRIGARWEHVRGRPRFRADNGEMLREAAVAGLGIVVLPSFIASPAIESGALEVLLRDFPIEEVGLHLVMPPGRATTARVRALIDFLAARFGPEPSWDPCWMKEKERGAGRSAARNPDRHAMAGRKKQRR